MTLDLMSLAIEVTRRCNMACAHCLRGKAQTIDIEIDKLGAFLKNVNSITTIVFTGGEPTLNVYAIEETLRICKEMNVPVMSFYVVTNGKRVTDRFLHAMLDWSLYCTEHNPYCNEYENGVVVSQDMFHEPIDEANIRKLKTLSAYREGEKTVDWKSVPPLRLGRARELPAAGIECRAPTRYEFSFDWCDESLVVEDTILISATGEILSECDYEYSEEKDLSLGNIRSSEGISEFMEVIEMMAMDSGNDDVYEHLAQMEMSKEAAV